MKSDTLEHSLLSELLQGMSEGVIVVSRAGLIESVNNAAEELFGYANAEIVGQNLDVLIPSVSQTRHRSLFDEFANGKQVRLSMGGRPETKSRRKDGTEFLIGASIGRVIHGEEVFFVAIVTDRTELANIGEQLRQSQKLEAVGQLTGGVAHDFNNMLAVVLGNLTMLEDMIDAGTSPSPEQILELIQPALRAGNHGAELIDRLLTFSRKKPLQPVVLEIDTVVRGMDALFRRTLGEHIDLRWHLNSEDWRAEADVSQLESALLNLAVNARDAMPAGGRLTIETGTVVLDEEYAQANQEVIAGEYVMLAVSDSGFGMDADTVKRVFEPFFTTKDVGEGTGLGLSMVYGFAKQSKGHVAIYSEPGEGTTVKLYLPRTGNSVAVDNVHEADTLSASCDELILVVEDDADVRQVATRMLRRHGYAVVETEDGNSAIAILRGKIRFDLLLTDVILPGSLSGPDLAKAAQQIVPGVKTLYMSGYTENAILHHGRLDEGVNLLSKPFSPRELGKAVRTALDAKD